MIGSLPPLQVKHKIKSVARSTKTHCPVWSRDSGLFSFTCTCSVRWAPFCWFGLATVESRAAASDPPSESHCERPTRTLSFHAVTIKPSSALSRPPSSPQPHIPIETLDNYKLSANYGRLLLGVVRLTEVVLNTSKAGKGGLSQYYDFIYAARVGGMIGWPRSLSKRVITKALLSI